MDKHEATLHSFLQRKGFQLQVEDHYGWEDRNFTFSHPATQTTCIWKVDSMHGVLEVELETWDMSKTNLEIASRALFHYLRKEFSNSHHMMLWLAEDEEGNTFLPFSANGYDIHPFTSLESSVLETWVTDYFSGQEGYYAYHLRCGNRSFRQAYTVIEQIVQVFQQLKVEDPTFFWEKHPYKSKSFPVFWKGFRYVISIDNHPSGLTLSFYKTDYAISFQSEEEAKQCYAKLYDLFYQIYRANRLTAVFEEKAYHFQEICKKMGLPVDLAEEWGKDLSQPLSFEEIELMVARTNHVFWRMEREIRMFSSGCDTWVFDLEKDDFHHFTDISQAKSFALERFLQQKANAFEKSFEQYTNDKKSV